jgi:hypothetical protein
VIITLNSLKDTWLVPLNRYSSRRGRENMWSKTMFLGS